MPILQGNPSTYAQFQREQAVASNTRGDAISVDIADLKGNPNAARETAKRALTEFAKQGYTDANGQHQNFTESDIDAELEHVKNTTGGYLNSDSGLLNDLNNGTTKTSITPSFAQLNHMQSRREGRAVDLAPETDDQRNALKQQEIDALGSDEQLREEARYNLTHLGLVANDADVEKEFQRLKQNSLGQDTQKSLRDIGTALQSGPVVSSLPGSLDGQAVSRLVGGAVGGLGTVANLGAGVSRVGDTILRNVPYVGETLSDWAPYRAAYNRLSQTGKGAEIISGESAKGAGLYGYGLNAGGRAAVDVPVLVGLTALSGGSDVLALTLHGALAAAGQGKDWDEVAKAGGEGYIFGKLFHGASKLGDFGEGAITNNWSKSVRNELIGKLTNQGVRIGTIGGGTFVTAKLGGASNEEAFNQAVSNTMLDFFTNAQKFGEIKDLANKVYRIRKDGKATDVLVTQNGDNLDLTDVTGKVSDNQIQAEILGKNAQGDAGKPVQVGDKAGTIKSVNKNGNYVVEFEDGSTKPVRKRDAQIIEPTDTNVAQSEQQQSPVESPVEQKPATPIAPEPETPPIAPESAQTTSLPPQSEPQNAGDIIADAQRRALEREGETPSEVSVSQNPDRAENPPSNEVANQATSESQPVEPKPETPVSAEAQEPAKDFSSEMRVGRKFTAPGRPDVWQIEESNNPNVYRVKSLTTGQVVEKPISPDSIEKFNFHPDIEPINEKASPKTFYNRLAKSPIDREAFQYREALDMSPMKRSKYLKARNAGLSEDVAMKYANEAEGSNDAFNAWKKEIKSAKPKVIGKPKGAPKADESRHSLSTYIQRSGGLRDGGVIDVSAVRDAKGGRFIVGKNRRSVEDAFQDAVESGYFPGETTEHTVVGKNGETAGHRGNSFTVHDFVNAVADDANGVKKHYSAHNLEKAQASLDELENQHYENKAKLDQEEQEQFEKQTRMMQDQDVRDLLADIESEGGRATNDQRNELEDHAGRHGIKNADWYADNIINQIHEDQRARERNGDESGPDNLLQETEPTTFGRNEVADDSFDFTEPETKPETGKSEEVAPEAKAPETPEASATTDKPTEKPAAKPTGPQTDLFGDPLEATHQEGLFGQGEINNLKNEQAKAERNKLTSAYGEETAGFINRLSTNADKAISSVARALSDAADIVRAKGDGARQIIESTADALDIFNRAKQLDISVDEYLLQPRLDEQPYSTQAEKYAKAMESGTFPKQLGKDLSEIETEGAETRDYKADDRVSFKLPSQDQPVSGTVVRTYAEGKNVEIALDEPTRNGVKKLLIPAEDLTPIDAEPAKPVEPAETKPTRKGEAGAIDPNLATLGLKSTYEQDIAPGARKVWEGLKGTADDILKYLIPTARGEDAKETGSLTRWKNANAARRNDMAQEALKTARKFFSSQKPEDNHAFIGAIEGGSTSSLSPDMRKTAKVMRDLLDDARERVQNLGEGKLRFFNENYFPHIWDAKSVKEANKAAYESRNQMDSNGNVVDPSTTNKQFAKNLEGSKNFLKRRSFDTFKEAIDYGYKPKSDNPVDLVLWKLREMNKYISANETINELKRQGLAKVIATGEAPPEGWTKLNDKIGNKSEKNQDGEWVITHHIWAPDQVATVINNSLSPGFRGKSVYEAYRYAGNALNQFQLGLSAFHLGFTSMDAMISKGALGLGELTTGHPIKAIKSIAGSPIAPITNIIRGDRVLRAWLDPASADPVTRQIANLVELAGGRAGTEAFYQTSAARKMVDAFRQGNILGGLVRAPIGIVDATAKPLMEYVVPRQKLGVFADLMKSELERLGPDATPKQVREASQRVWDSVDNRMGQMVYDNIFWNNAAKDLAMGSVRSVGWNLGTLREVGGALADTVTAPGRAVKAIRAGQQGVKPVVTYRMAYLGALTAYTGVLGGMINYLYTGERPKELKDYFFPRTGRIDDNGRPERVSLPTYMKDLYAYYKKPGTTLSHKIHPILSLAAETWNNEDYFGTEIRNKNDGVMKQLLDTAQHVGQSAMPFSLQNFDKMKGSASLKGLENLGLPSSASQTIGGPLLRTAGFLGLTKAPKELENTTAEDKLSQIMDAKPDMAPRTKEEARRSQVILDLSKQVRNGKDVSDEFQKAVDAGIVKPEDMKAVKNKADKSWMVRGMKSLALPDALSVYKAATDDEKVELKSTMETKANNRDQKGDLSQAERDQLKELGITLTPKHKAPRKSAAYQE